MLCVRRFRNLSTFLGRGEESSQAQFMFPADSGPTPLQSLGIRGIQNAEKALTTATHGVLTSGVVLRPTFAPQLCRFTPPSQQPNHKV